jgi:hypothetical protein
VNISGRAAALEIVPDIGDVANAGHLLAGLRRS